MDLERFGIMIGQMRSHCGRELVHNGGWYDADGLKIGWGDLSEADLVKASRELKEGEKFIVLPEGASFWNFVKFNPGPTGVQATAEPSEQNPGMDYIRAEASWVVLPGRVYRITRYGGELGEQKRNGLKFTAIRDASEVL
jgi:hypothetical protein